MYACMYVCIYVCMPIPSDEVTMRLGTTTLTPGISGEMCVPIVQCVLSSVCIFGLQWNLYIKTTQGTRNKWSVKRGGLYTEVPHCSGVGIVGNTVMVS